MVLWLSLLGASLALRSERHIKLELLLRFFPKWVKTWAFRTTSLFGMAVMAILFWAAISFFKEELSIFGAQGWFSLISPLFFGLMTFRYLIRFLSTFTRHIDRETSAFS
jgi:TRAP-type C4-dicarboxylate transport system permease small subunit